MSLANLPDNNRQDLLQVVNPKKLLSGPPLKSPETLSPRPQPAASTPTDVRQELATARELLRYQQDLIDSLTQQLTQSDRRIGELEAELNQTRQQCDRQLQEATARCADLHARLQRQQHQAYQYKVALEQCVEVKPQCIPRIRDGSPLPALELSLE